MGIALTHRLLWVAWTLKQYWFLQSTSTQYLSIYLCVFFSFFHQCDIVQMNVSTPFWEVPVSCGEAYRGHSTGVPLPNYIPREHLCHLEMCGKHEPCPSGWSSRTSSYADWGCVSVCRPCGASGMVACPELPFWLLQVHGAQKQAPQAPRAWWWRASPVWASLLPQVLVGLTLSKPSASARLCPYPSPTWAMCKRVQNSGSSVPLSQRKSQLILLSWQKL